MLIEYDYDGLIKIVSGGQRGADRGALDAARAKKIPTGGFAATGYATCNGPAPELASYGLVEGGTYQERTVKNVTYSDGTLIIASNMTSVGTALTIRECFSKKKPLYAISCRSDDYRLQSRTLDEVIEWLNRHCITTLNVAGNRDKVGTKHYDLAHEVISQVIDRIRSV